MKKIIILIIVLTAPLLLRVTGPSERPIRVQVEEQGYSKVDKNLNWEFIKDKLYEGKIARTFKTALKFKGPVLLVLHNATSQDSLALETSINEIQPIIKPIPIAYFSDFMGQDYKEYCADKKQEETKGFSPKEILTSTIMIDFGKVALNPNEISHGVVYKGLSKTTPEDYFCCQVDQYVQMYFRFLTNMSLEERQHYLQYEFVKVLAFAQALPKTTALLNITYPIEAIFNEPTYSVEDKEFTEIDQFLLHKLYADDFEEQFSDYMYHTYPFRYAHSFIYQNLVSSHVILVLIFYGVLIFISFFGVYKEMKFKNSYLSYLIPFVVIKYSLDNFERLYIHFTEVGYATMLHPYLLFGQVLLEAILLSFILWKIEKRSLNRIRNFTYRFIFKLVFTFLVLNLSAVFSYAIYGHLFEFELSFGLLTVNLILTLGRGLFMYLNYFSDTLIQKQEVELSKLKELNAENELKSLHAHINPHFLYNALNSIASLTQENAAKAEEMILSLSNLFRYSINRKGEKMSTIEDEVLMVKNYLKIEKIRFDERLNFTIEVQENLLKKEIPKYILQPLVENSVKHGISKIKNNGSIRLKIKEENAMIRIEIFDSGPEFPEGLFGGYGLQSVYDLLRLSYGEIAMLNWENTPEKKIMILIPLKK